ncbi:MAG: lysophospholipid acyltransferase family protein [Planctomycetota bacterium]
MNRPLYWLSHVFVRTFVNVWHRRSLTGASNLPSEGGVLVVGNHTSFLDPPLVGTSLRHEVRFMARETLLKIPFFGAWMRAVGTVFLPRGGDAKAAILTACRLLTEGRVVCLFPEGSRSDDGAVGEFERGVLLILRRTPVPVLPLGIQGAREAMGRGKNWPRPRKIRMRYAAPLSPDEVLAPGGLEALRAQVADLASAPVRPAEEPSNDSTKATADKRSA